MLVGTVLGCVAGIHPSSSYGLFVASRLIIGSGNTTFLMTAPIIMQEVVSDMPPDFVSRRLIGSLILVIEDSCALCGLLNGLLEVSLRHLSASGAHMLPRPGHG